MKIALLVLLLVGSLYSAEPFSLKYTDAREFVDSPEAAEKEARRSVFRLEYTSTSRLVGHGTAFGVDVSAFGYTDTAYLLSAYHNTFASDKTPVVIRVEVEKEWVVCSVIAVDKTLDLCLLKAVKTLPSVLKLSNVETIENDKIVLVGSPNGVPITVTKGWVLQCYRDGTPLTKAAVTEFGHGYSGGPVVDQRSFKVVGVITSGVPDAIHADQLSPVIALYAPISTLAYFLRVSCKKNPNSH